MADKEQGGDVEGRRRSTFLDPKEIKRLIGILSQAGGLELELEDQGTRLKIKMPEPHSRTEFVQVPGPYPFSPGPAAPVQPPADAAAADSEALPPGAVHIESPMVGTFYRSLSPDAAPFVKVGDTIGAETTICILEAMKVMNEIKAEQDCEVLKILVENGEPVEFGQPPLLVRPS